MKPKSSLKERVRAWWRRNLDERGREVLDPTPVAVPVNFKKPPTLNEQIKLMVKAMSAEAQSQGKESFEEADDFDIADDPVDPSSPWEANYEVAEAARGVRAEQAAQAEAAKSRPKPSVTEERPVDGKKGGDDPAPK